MKRISYWIRNAFGFSQTEARGFIVLIFVLLLALLLPFATRFLYHNSYTNFQADQRLLDSLSLVMEAAEKNQKAWQANFRPTAKTPSRFLFDPNTAQEKDLAKLGMSFRAIRSVMAYRKKGGKFFVKKDLGKMYGLPKQEFDALKPYIALPDSLPRKVNVYKSPQRIALLDLNLADTVQLMQLKGIGSKRATRIVKYREALGGFISMEQIREVYGLDTFSIQELSRKSFVAANFEVRRVNLNKAARQELAAHPYIGYKLAGTMVDYRLHHGDYTVAEDLLKLKVVDAKKIDQLRPYLEF